MGRARMCLLLFIVMSIDIVVPNALQILCPYNGGIRESMLEVKKSFWQKHKIEVNFTFVETFSVTEYIQKDVYSASPRYDGYVSLLTEMSTHASKGVLASFQEETQSVEAEWHDVFSTIKQLTQYNGETYAMPIDADFLLMVYREDLFEKYNLKSPNTWTEYAEIAEFFHGKDLNNDNKPDFGNCYVGDFSARFSTLFYGAAAPYMQFEGTKEGVFFEPTTMKPRFKSKAFEEAARMNKRLYKNSPAEEFESPSIFDIHGYFSEGRCALALLYPGSMKYFYYSKNTSQMKLQLGMPPGVIERHSAGTITRCREHSESCPYAVYETVHNVSQTLSGVNNTMTQVQDQKELVSDAPFLSTGGWSFFARRNLADSKREDDTKKLGLYVMSTSVSKKYVSDSGILDPFRYSQVLDREFWLTNWVGRRDEVEDLMNDLFPIVFQCLSHSNFVPDLSVPASSRFLRNFGSIVKGFYKDEKTLESTINELQTNWTSIVNEEGKEFLIDIYRGGLGLPPLLKPAENSEFNPTALVVTIAVLGTVLLLACALASYVRRLHARQLKQLRMSTADILKGRDPLTDVGMAADLKRYFLRKFVVALLSAVFDLVSIILDWLAFSSLYTRFYETEPGLWVAYGIRAMLASAASLYVFMRRIPWIIKHNERRTGLVRIPSKELVAQFLSFEEPYNRLLRFDVESKEFLFAGILFFMKDLPSFFFNSYIIFDAAVNGLPPIRSVVASLAYALIKVGVMVMTCLQMREVGQARTRLRNQLYVSLNEKKVELVDVSDSDASPTS